MKKLTLLTLLAMLFAQTLLAITFPTPPAGFVWQEIPELKAALLKRKDGFTSVRNRKVLSLISSAKRISIRRVGFKQGLLSMCFTSRKILR